MTVCDVVVVVYLSQNTRSKARVMTLIGILPRLATVEERDRTAYLVLWWTLKGACHSYGFLI
jgi:hypothetical protein